MGIARETPGPASCGEGSSSLILCARSVAQERLAAPPLAALQSHWPGRWTPHTSVSQLRPPPPPPPLSSLSSSPFSPPLPPENLLLEETLASLGLYPWGLPISAAEFGEQGGNCPKKPLRRWEPPACCPTSRCKCAASPTGVLLPSPASGSPNLPGTPTQTAGGSGVRAGAGARCTLGWLRAPTLGSASCPHTGACSY